MKMSIFFMIFFAFVSHGKSKESKSVIRRPTTSLVSIFKKKRPTPKATYSFANATIVGSGCPAGTTSQTFSPDNQALSVLYDQYAAGTRSGLSYQAKDCMIRLPITIPQGMEVSRLNINWRGFMSLPSSTDAKLFFQYFIKSGTKMINSQEYVYDYNQALTSNFSINTPQEVLDKTCGTDTTLFIQSRIQLSSNGNSQVIMDSTDLSRTDNVSVEWRPCNASTTAPEIKFGDMWFQNKADWKFNFNTRPNSNGVVFQNNDSHRVYVDFSEKGGTIKSVQPSAGCFSPYVYNPSWYYNSIPEWQFRCQTNVNYPKGSICVFYVQKDYGYDTCKMSITVNDGVKDTTRVFESVPHYEDPTNYNPGELIIAR